MRRTGSLIILAALMVGCASSRKTERTVQIETAALEATHTVTGTVQTLEDSNAEASSACNAERLDSGRVTIERDSAGLPVAINWRRRLTDSATMTRREHHQQASESNETAESSASEVQQTVTDTQIVETDRKHESPRSRLRVAIMLAVLYLLFVYLWRTLKK